MCHTPIVIRGHPFTLWPFSQGNKRNNQRWHVRLMLSEQVLARWRLLVALRKAMNLLYQAMHTVWYHCTTAAIKTAHKVGTFVVDVLFAVTLAAAGAIRSKELPDSSFEGHQV
jgi:hypothetical protein